MKKHQGFTLLEVLIAVFIFSIISALVAQGMRQLTSVKTALDQKIDFYKKIQTAEAWMDQDFSQVTGKVDDRSIPIFSLKKNENNVVLEFSRFAFHRLYQFPKASSVERVRYEIRDHQLIRYERPLFLELKFLESQKRIILEDIQSCTVRVLDEEKQFYATWPRVENFLKQPIPRLIEITFTFKNNMTLPRFFVLTGRTYVKTVH